MDASITKRQQKRPNRNFQVRAVTDAGELWRHQEACSSGRASSNSSSHGSSQDNPYSQAVSGKTVAVVAADRWLLLPAAGGCCKLGNTAAYTQARLRAWFEAARCVQIRSPLPSRAKTDRWNGSGGTLTPRHRGTSQPACGHFGCRCHNCCSRLLRLLSKCCAALLPC